MRCTTPSASAARQLVDKLCGDYDIPLLVLHDFDKSGFTIVGTLRRDTRRYRFKHAIKVIDLGLRIGDIEGLETEAVYHRGDEEAIIANLAENGATDVEIDFLLGAGSNSTPCLPTCCSLHRTQADRGRHRQGRS
jgi:hypothetical protein